MVNTASGPKRGGAEDNSAEPRTLLMSSKPTVTITHPRLAFCESTANDTFCPFIGNGFSLYKDDDNECDD